MKLVWLVFLLLVTTYSHAAVDTNERHEQYSREYTKQYVKNWEFKNELFSYDGINLNDSSANIKKILKNCKKIDYDNWNYRCEGEKTYLLAFRDGSLKRFRVVEDMSFDEMTKRVAQINSKYGPANLIIRNVHRPFNNLDSNKLFDGNFVERSVGSATNQTVDAEEPFSYIWSENDNYSECCASDARGKELKIKYWFGSMMLTVSDNDLAYYEEQKPQYVEDLILSNKTAATLGLNFALKGLVFLFFIFLYKHFIKSSGEGVSSIIVGTLVATALGLLLFKLVNVFIDLDWIGDIVVLSVAGLVALIINYKKL